MKESQFLIKRVIFHNFHLYPLFILEPLIVHKLIFIVGFENVKKKRKEIQKEIQKRCIKKIENREKILVRYLLMKDLIRKIKIKIIQFIYGFERYIKLKS